MCRLNSWESKEVHDTRIVGHHATKYMEPSVCFKQNSVALLVQYLGLSYVGQLLHNYARYLFRSNDANAHM